VDLLKQGLFGGYEQVMNRPEKSIPKQHLSEYSEKYLQKHPLKMAEISHF
jgi:hypothetical protein